MIPWTVHIRSDDGSQIGPDWDVDVDVEVHQEAGDVPCVEVRKIECDGVEMLTAREFWIRQLGFHFAAFLEDDDAFAERVLEDHGLLFWRDAS